MENLEGCILSDGEASLVCKDVPSSCFKVEVSMMDSTTEYIKRNVRCVSLALVFCTRQCFIEQSKPDPKNCNVLKMLMPVIQH